MARQQRTGVSIETFLESLGGDPPQRVAGTAMFMAGNAGAVPRALLRNFECNKVLHQRIVLLTVVIREIPWVSAGERVECEALRHGFHRLIVRFGFMDRPDVSAALALCKPSELLLEPLTTWFLLSRATVIPTPGEGMMLWREKLFATMARHARTAGDYFNIPADRVIEIGTRIEI